jgi:hypothetical protein
MAYAAQEGYAIFTKDLDFGDMLYSTNAAKPSVIQIRSDYALPERLFPQVREAYDGFYTPLAPLAGHELTLAGPDGIVGTRYEPVEVAGDPPVVQGFGETVEPTATPQVVTPAAPSDQAATHQVVTPGSTRGLAPRSQQKGEKRHSGSQDDAPNPTTALNGDNPGLLRGLYLASADGRLLMPVRGEGGTRLLTHLRAGWRVQVVLSAVWFSQESKSYTGELGCMCWRGDLELAYEQAMQAFAANMAHRIMRGTHPGLALTQDQYMRVLQSGGTWYLTKDVPLPKQPQGTVVYRRRRGATEGLVAMSTTHHAGCTVAASVFWIVLLALIVFAVWWFFFR